jgi:hypothetical protein
MPETGINVDLMGRNGGVGEVASYVSQNGQLDPGVMKPFYDEQTRGIYVSVYKGRGDFNDPKNYSTRKVKENVSPLQVNATLRRDEWKRLDEVVVTIAEERLNGVQDLLSNGLTYELGNGMGTTVLEWHDVGDALEADLTMDGLPRAQNDRPEWQHNYLPIPIIHADYEINTRALTVSRNMGNAIDTTMAERAARKINLKLEQMLFTDTSYAFGALDDRSRNSIYSYLNFPDRETATLGAGWATGDSSGTPTGRDIVKQVIDWKQQMFNIYQRGPFMMYIPLAYETIMDEDYVDTNPDTRTTGTIRERILKIGAIQDVKVVDTLPADTVLLVQMNRETVRLVRGMGVQNVQWTEEGQFVTKYKVMTIQVPQIRSDQNGRCGILHVS